MSNTAPGITAVTALGSALGVPPEVRRRATPRGALATFHWRTRHLPSWELTGAGETILALQTGGGRVWARVRSGWSERFSAPGLLHLIPVGSGGAFHQAGRLEFMSLHLDDERLSDLTRQQRSQSNPFRTRWAFDDAFVRHSLQRLSDELRQPGEHGPMLVQSLTDAIWLHLLNRDARRAHRSVAPPSRIARAQERIRECIVRGVSLDELADEAGLSRWHFARAFRQAVGEPPHRYLTRCRIERAVALLRDRELSLAEIALRVGYSSQSHFSAAFQAIAGRTPRQFRAGFASAD